MTPLGGVRIVSLATNVPGPVAAARLHVLGAAVVKVEPPGGDALAQACPSWYAALCAGQDVIRLDLKAPGDRARLDDLLAESDLLLTSMRPAALSSLALDPATLQARYPRLVRVAIVGHPGAAGNAPGHDLTYLAECGLLAAPRLPLTLMADLAGAERAVGAALGLLLARERGHGAGYAEVALAEVARSFAEPLRHGLTAPGAALGGGLPGYNLYAAQDGWIAVAALEPHFWQRLVEKLGAGGSRQEDLARAFATRSADAWEAWAAEHDLPLAAVRGAGS